MKHLDMIDELLTFAEKNPSFPINWYKSVAAIRVQALLDIDKPSVAEIPSVEEVDE